MNKQEIEVILAPAVRTNEKDKVLVVDFMGKNLQLWNGRTTFKQMSALRRHLYDTMAYKVYASIVIARHIRAGRINEADHPDDSRVRDIFKGIDIEPLAKEIDRLGVDLDPGHFFLAYGAEEKLKPLTDKLLELGVITIKEVSI